MRPPMVLTILAAGGVTVACLLLGVAGGSACASGMAQVACLGGSVGSVQDLFAVAGAVGVILGSLLAISVLWQVRHHRQLAELLDRTSRRAWLADHEVG